MWRARLESLRASDRVRTGLAAVIAFGLAGTAIAQDIDEREVLIGTMRLGNPPALRGEADPGEAEALLHAALATLGDGYPARAQRQLEVLVGRHPETDAAARARRHLAAIYGHLDRPPLSGAAAVEGAGRNSLDANVRRSELRSESVRLLGERLRMDVGDRVFFGPGSAELGARAHIVLAGQADWLKRQPELVATIEGHADDPGPAEEDLRLAAARAEAVRQRLVNEGVSLARLRVQAAGSSERIAVCAEPACAAQNRRAVTLVHTPGTFGRGQALGEAPAAGMAGRAVPIAGEPPRGSRLPR